MSSRSKGVTNVRFSRSTTSRVSLSPSCSSSLTARGSAPSDGNSSSRRTSSRAMPTAFSDARSSRRKNCLFWGTSEIRDIGLLSCGAGLQHLRFAAELEDACDETAVCPVDELVAIDERLCPFEVTVAERVERDPDHLLAPRTHLLEALDETGSGIDFRHELRELRDRH